MIVRIVGGRSSVGHAMVARVGHDDFKYTHWKDDPGVDNMADLGTEGVSKAVLAHLLESSGLHQPGSGHCVASLSRVVGGYSKIVQVAIFLLQGLLVDGVYYDKALITQNSPVAPQQQQHTSWFLYWLIAFIFVLWVTVYEVIRSQLVKLRRSRKVDKRVGPDHMSGGLPNELASSVIFVAPSQGTKFHLSDHCRGFNLCSNIKSYSMCLLCERAKRD